MANYLEKAVRDDVLSEDSLLECEAGSINDKLKLNDLTKNPKKKTSGAK